MNIKQLGCNKGSALIAVIGVSLVVGLGLAYLFDRVISLKKSNVSSAHAIEKDIIINSVLDMVKLGVKQRWCFGEGFLRDGDCDLKHPNNVERLLLTSESLSSIKRLKAEGVDVPTETPIALNRIAFTVNLNELAEAHPLKTTLESLPDLSDVRVNVSIQKLENDELYSRSTESILEVKVRLQLGLTSEGSEIKSIMVVYPQEISTFALVVANDLHIGSSKGLASLPRGDSAIPKAPKNSKGLVFDSPIYVNRNIYLNSRKKKDYTPVTFAGDVYMGLGKLMSKNGSQPFIPASLGAQNDRLYTDILSFGGFQKGLTIVGELDFGLDYISRREATVDTGKADTLRLCLARNAALTNLKKTKKSDLTAKLTSSIPGEYQFELGLTDMNRFSEQYGISDGFKSVPTPQDYFTHSYTRITSNEKAVAQVSVNFNGTKGVAVRMAKNSRFTLSPKFFNLGALKATRNSTRNDIENLKDEISKLKNKIEKLKNDLAVEEAKTPPDKSKIKSIKSDISSREGQVSSKEYTLGIKEEQLVVENAAVARAEIITANPPVMEVSLVDKMMPEGGNNYSQFNQMNLKVKFTNSQYFDIVPTFSINAFDVGSDYGEDIRSGSTYSEDHGTYNGELKFFKNSGNIVPLVYSNNWKNMREDNQGDSVRNPVDSDYNYGYLDEVCNDPASGLSFESASWEQNFLANTRHSWDFAEPSSHPGIPNKWRIGGSGIHDESTFYIRSIVKRCEIESSVSFFAGFVTCDELVIKPRSTPLVIVGTFIVGKMQIAKSAMISGITWYNIYHPNAVKILRQKRILKPVSNPSTSCKDLATPIWHPRPDIYEFADHYKCNSLSLRSEASPFTWTTVDPDCGLATSESRNTTCKNRPRRFYIKELGRSVQ